MLLCAVSLSRVQDQFLLLSLFLNSFSLNFAGALFEICYYAERKTDDPAFKLFIKRLKWMTFWTSWFYYGINLYTTWDAFNSVIKPYFALATAPLWRQLFDLARYANIGTFVYFWQTKTHSNKHDSRTGITTTFTIFPLVHFYQFGRTMFKSWNRDKEEGVYTKQIAAYRRGEVSYIWASFISKTTLVVLFGFVSFNRRE